MGGGPYEVGSSASHVYVYSNTERVDMPAHACTVILNAWTCLRMRIQ